MPRAIARIPLPELVVGEFCSAATAIPAKNAHGFPGLVRADIFLSGVAEFFDQLVLWIPHGFLMPRLWHL